MKKKRLAVFGVSVFLFGLIGACIAGDTPDKTQKEKTNILDFGFAKFVPWANPISDYIETNENLLGHRDFRTSINDLVVYRDQLYLGYGDADLNLGRNTPIEVRFFDSLDSSGVKTQFATDEEEISHYRIVDDTLLLPGVDATEDNLLGNVYSLQPQGDWQKSRTLVEAWHVHDIAGLNTAYYACGSGGTLDDYDNSTVNAFLWRSSDGGETFEIAHKLPHPSPPGDFRLVHLAAVSSTLYAFGYYSSGDVAYASNYRLTGTALEPYTPDPAFFVTGTWPLDQSSAVVVGVAITNPQHKSTQLLTEQGLVPIAALEQTTVHDMLPLGDGTALVLYKEGNSYPPPVEDGAYLVGLLDTQLELQPLLQQHFEPAPKSVAFWKGSLFLGLLDGEIWRAAGE